MGHEPQLLPVPRVARYQLSIIYTKFRDLVAPTQNSLATTLRVGYHLTGCKMLHDQHLLGAGEGEWEWYTVIQARFYIRVLFFWRGKSIIRAG